MNLSGFCVILTSTHKSFHRQQCQRQFWSAGMRSLFYYYYSSSDVLLTITGSENEMSNIQGVHIASSKATQPIQIHRANCHTCFNNECQLE